MLTIHIIRKYHVLNSWTVVKKLIFLVIFFVVCIFVFADEIVYTADGKKVLLRENGTWEYVVEESDTDQFDF